MAIVPHAKEVMNEMVNIQQILRETSPNHKLNEEQKMLVMEAIKRSEEILAKMGETVQ